MTTRLFIHIYFLGYDSQHEIIRSSIITFQHPTVYTVKFFVNFEFVHDERKSSDGYGKHRKYTIRSTEPFC